MRRSEEQDGRQNPGVFNWDFFDFNKEHLRLKDVESIQLEFPGECAGKSQKVVSRFESGTPNSSGFLSFSLLSWPCCDCGFVQAQIRIDQHI